MKKYFTAGITALTLLAPLACGKIYNSSSYDSTIYGTATGSAQFLAAKTIITQNCASCHTRPSHEAWAGMDEAAFKTARLIEPGSLINSQLYTKILGNRTTTPGNMPDGGTPLSSAQLDTIEDWIVNATP
jgi:mono/diheme cytochrome c family protein